MSLEQGPGAAGRSLQQVPYLMIMAPLVSHSPPKPKLSLQEQLLNYLQSSKSTYSYSPPYPESHSSASHVSWPCQLLKNEDYNVLLMQGWGYIKVLLFIAVPHARPR